MAIKQNLDLRTTQGLALTPQLREAIELLQLSHLDLFAFVQAELDQNPFLESPENGPDHGERDSLVASSGNAPASSVDYESFVAKPESLREHLMGQIKADIEDDFEQKIAFYLLDSLSEDGYLAENTGSIASTLGVSSKSILTVLKKVQQCDPIGIFARNMQECFSLQFKEMGFLGEEIDIFVSHLNLVASQEYKKLAKLCGVSVESILDYIEILKSLNPKPAQGFGTEDIKSVIPDVLVEKNSQGHWGVSLNPHALPKVIANNAYFAEIKDQPISKKDKAYVNNTFQRASWLVKALDQRAKTILSVAQAIMSEQESFLNRGLNHLRPLILKQIAETTDLHESTVSRVTSNKYIETPRGVFELKFFFSSKLGGSHAGEEYASEAIRTRIKHIIENEDKLKPLSDDKIVKMLQSDGVCIARRTVAKYRDILKIPSTSLRRIRKVI